MGRGWEVHLGLYRDFELIIMLCALPAVRSRTMVQARRTAPPECHEVQWDLSYLPEQVIPALRWPEVRRASLLSKCKARVVKVGVTEWRASRQGLGVCKM
jgi:hypothetical protein